MKEHTLYETSDLVELVKSRIPIIVFESQEEKFVVSLFQEISTKNDIPLYRWNVINGLATFLNGRFRGAQNLEPIELLFHIWNVKRNGIYVLLDFHPYLQNDRHIRLLKEIAQNAEVFKQTIVLLSHKIDVPMEIEQFVARFQLPLPDDQTIEKEIMKAGTKWQRQNPDKKITADREILDLLIKNLKGLSIIEVKKLVHKALLDGALTEDDIPEINKAKYQLLNKDDVLYYEHNTADFAEVGGLSALKKWLTKRKAIFLGEKEVHGIQKPKGVLLLGVQGSGKSLAAKAVAGTWHVPLLRLDFGTLYNKYYGETERKTRAALKMAEAMAPCVLWIDEIEKGLSTDSSDGGTSRRVLGTLLTWMAERESAAFVVATANDIQSLPPELLRKGRLDEIFFVDLPDLDVRKTIFTIHLKKRDLDPKDFDVDLLAKESEGFSGAEIEQSIVSGLYSVVGSSGHLNNDILFDEIKNTRPLSVIMAEKINGMRIWALDRTVSAN